MTNLNVLITIDVEIWCDGWEDIDRKFPDAFRRYIYGPTKQGNCGLPLTLQILNDAGIKASFFVEPLFSLRFGQAALDEIVGLIQEADQDIQLHLHSEWVDEATTTVFPHIQEKRQHLRYFSLEEQTALIKLGKQCLHKAGVKHLNAFRAGSYALNQDTLRALKENNIFIDSSYNPCLGGIDSPPFYQARLLDGVYEYPISVYKPFDKSLRHAQIAACSFKELTGMLYQAFDNNWESFIIVSHGFELMNTSNTKANKITIRRFKQLCDFLAKNKDKFTSVDFTTLTPKIFPSNASPLRISPHISAQRILEQVIQRITN